MRSICNISFNVLINIKTLVCYFIILASTVAAQAGCNCAEDGMSSEVIKLIQHNAKSPTSEIAELADIVNSRKQLSSEDQSWMKNAIANRPKLSKTDQSWLKKVVDKRNNEALKNIEEKAVESNSTSKGGVNASKYEILVFVSLSMPLSSIKNMMKHYEGREVRFLLRGFKDDSLPKTFKVFADILKSTGASLDIDPEAFKKHEIKRVPAFVVRDKSDKNKFDKLSGSVTFNFLKQVIKSKGEMGGLFNV